MNIPKTNHTNLKKIKGSQPLRKILLWVGIWSALAMSLQDCKTTDGSTKSSTLTSLEIPWGKTTKPIKDRIYDLKNILILPNDKTYIVRDRLEETNIPNQSSPFEDKGEILHGIREKTYKSQIDRYQNEQNQILPPLSSEETEQMDKMLAKNTIRCGVLRDKPTMEKVNYIALHSTGSTKPEVIKYLQKTGKVHYIILQDGSIIQYLPSNRNVLAQQNHLGKWGDPISCASRDRNDQITFETIGIEIMAWAAKRRSEKEYESLEILLRYLSNKYNIKKGNIISHTMVAYNPAKGMMRKYDPFELDREKLNLPPNDIQINKDILAGRIAPNLISMYKRLRKWYRGGDPGPWYSHEEAITYIQKHYAWVNYAILLHKDANKGQINPNAHLAKEVERWLSIEELDKFMKNYTPPVEISRHIKHTKKPPHNKKHTRR